MPRLFLTASKNCSVLLGKLNAFSLILKEQNFTYNSQVFCRVKHHLFSIWKFHKVHTNEQVQMNKNVYKQQSSAQHVIPLGSGKKVINRWRLLNIFQVTRNFAHFSIFYLLFYSCLLPTILRLLFIKKFKIPFLG